MGANLSILGGKGWAYLRECFPAHAVRDRPDHRLGIPCLAARRQEAEVYAIASPFSLRAAVVSWGKAGLECGLLGFLRVPSLRACGETTELLREEWAALKLERALAFFFASIWLPLCPP